MKRFSKGDFAITVNSRAPSVNDGHLVIVREVCGAMPERGLDFAYLIERVDGEAFAITCIPGTSLPGRSCPKVYTGEHQLRPLGGPRRGKARRARAKTRQESERQADSPR
ncbi:MAG: hypothetical protein EXR31_02455 [Betaproteobacteria bacterium]|nr:hypothetical protein [Betaproteobacteria bacterium]